MAHPSTDTLVSSFAEGSSKLIMSSIKSKTEELRRLHELDILSQRCLRNALAAAAVDRTQHIENCNQNLDYLKTEVQEGGSGLCENKTLLVVRSSGWELVH